MSSDSTPARYDRPEPLEPPDPTLPPEAEGQEWAMGWWAVGAPPEPKT